MLKLMCEYEITTIWSMEWRVPCGNRSIHAGGHTARCNNTIDMRGKQSNGTGNITYATDQKIADSQLVANDGTYHFVTSFFVGQSWARVPGWASTSHWSVGAICRKSIKYMHENEKKSTNGQHYIHFRLIRSSKGCLRCVMEYRCQYCEVASR